MHSQGWFPLELTGLISLLSKGLSRVFFRTTVWKYLFFGSQLSLWSSSHICTWLQGVLVMGTTILNNGSGKAHYEDAIWAKVKAGKGPYFADILGQKIMERDADGVCPEVWEQEESGLGWWGGELYKCRVTFYLPSKCLYFVYHDHTYLCIMIFALILILN